MNDPLLTIGEMARRSGVAASALRYYESRGMIQARRTAAGHRRFPRAALRRVAFIVFAQRVGMSLDEVQAELAKLPSDHVPTGRDWQRLSGPWRARIDAQIAALERLRDSLAGCIGCGCLSLRQCELLNPGDVYGRDGAGPRYWTSGTAREPGPGPGRKT